MLSTDITIRLLRELLHMHEDRIMKRKATQIESAMVLARNQTEAYLQEWMEGFSKRTMEQLCEQENKLTSLMKEGESFCSKAAAIIKRWNDEDAEGDILFRKIEADLRTCMNSVDRMTDDSTSDAKSLEVCLLKKKMHCLEMFKSKAIKVGPKGLRVNSEAPKKLKA